MIQPFDTTTRINDVVVAQWRTLQVTRKVQWDFSAAAAFAALLSANYEF